MNELPDESSQTRGPKRKVSDEGSFEIPERNIMTNPSNGRDAVLCFCASTPETMQNQNPVSQTIATHMFRLHVNGTRVILRLF